MKERWFNYRPIFLVFCFLLLGSVFAFYINTHKLVASLIALFILALLIVVSLWKNKAKYLFIPLVAFVIGCLAYNLAVLNFNSTNLVKTPETIQVRISNISSERNGVMMVEADSCIFDDVECDGNLRLYIHDSTGLFENIAVGNIIKFKPYKFYKTDLFYYDTPNARTYAKNLKYTTIVYAYNIEYISTDKNIAEQFKNNVKDNLSLGLSNENVEIVYSALFGDKDLLSNKKYSAYKLSGVAHLLAVSGLHVGIIVAILNFIFNKLNANKWAKFVFISLFLGLYAYLCGFSISVVRASIMALVLMFARNTGRQYDSLNSIGIAGIVIFIINPLCIFDVGFLLSFACVLGITLFYATFSALFQHTKMNKKLADSLAISLATSLSFLIIMKCYFKTVNAISLVANVILIPIFTFGFTFVFILSLLSLVVRQIAYLMYPANYIFDFINLSANILGHLPISNFETIDVAFISILVYFVLLLFLSRFCTAKKSHKLLASVPIFIFLVVCLLI